MASIKEKLALFVVNPYFRYSCYILFVAIQNIASIVVGVPTLGNTLFFEIYLIPLGKNSVASRQEFLLLTIFLPLFILDMFSTIAIIFLNDDRIFKNPPPLDKKGEKPPASKRRTSLLVVVGLCQFIICLGWIGLLCVFLYAYFGINCPKDPEKFYCGSATVSGGECLQDLYAAINSPTTGDPVYFRLPEETPVNESLGYVILSSDECENSKGEFSDLLLYATNIQRAVSFFWKISSDKEHIFPYLMSTNLYFRYIVEFKNNAATTIRQMVEKIYGKKAEGDDDALEGLECLECLDCFSELKETISEKLKKLKEYATYYLFVYFVQMVVNSLNGLTAASSVLPPPEGDQDELAASSPFLPIFIMDILAVIAIYFFHDRFFFRRKTPKQYKVVYVALVIEGLVILALFGIFIVVCIQVAAIYAKCSGYYCTCYAPPPPNTQPTCTEKSDCGTGDDTGAFENGDLDVYDQVLTGVDCIDAVKDDKQYCVSVISGRCDFVAGGNTQVFFKNDTSRKFSAAACDVSDVTQCLNSGSGIEDVLRLLVITCSILQRWVWSILSVGIVPMIAPSAIYYWKIYKGSGADGTKNNLVVTKIAALERLPIKRGDNEDTVAGNPEEEELQNKNPDNAPQQGGVDE